MYAIKQYPPVKDRLILGGADRKSRGGGQPTKDGF